MKKSFLFFVITLIVSSVFTAPGNLIRTINDPKLTAQDWFGRAVAVMGNDIIIGAPGDDTLTSQAGCVYLFDANTSSPLLTINNPSPFQNNPPPGDGDEFGSAVAALGERIIIGAPDDDTNGSHNGSVYVFDGTLRGVTSTPLLTITNPRTNDSGEFGLSVAAVGDNILVGAPFNDFGATSAGSAYLFDSTTGTLLLTINNPHPVYDAQFGRSVSALGDDLVVGSYGDTSGTVYLFDGSLRGITSIPLLKIISPPKSWYFGWSLAAADNKIVVGAPHDNLGGYDSGAAYLYDGTERGLVSLPLLTMTSPNPGFDRAFGWSVFVRQNDILVGQPGILVPSSYAGSVYLFSGSQTGVTSTTLLSINSPSQIPNEFFGWSTAVGNYIAVGAYGNNTGGVRAGAVYLIDSQVPVTLSRLAFE